MSQCPSKGRSWYKNQDIQQKINAAVTKISLLFSIPTLLHSMMYFYHNRAEITNHAKLVCEVTMFMV